MNILSRSADIILADSQVLITEGLKSILKDSVIASVSSRDELLKILKERAPSLLIIDHALIELDSIDQIKELINSYPQTVIIILTNAISRKEIVELNGCGIKNILSKLADKEELIDCIEAALKRKKYYSQQVLDLIMEQPEKRIVTTNQVQLTASEIEIVRLLSQGLTNKDIARKKFLSVHTIMTHRKNIMRKLGATNASEMIMFAIRLGLIDNIEYHI